MHTRMIRSACLMLLMIVGCGESDSGDTTLDAAVGPSVPGIGGGGAGLADSGGAPVPGSTGGPGGTTPTPGSPGGVIAPIDAGGSADSGPRLGGLFGGTFGGSGFPGAGLPGGGGTTSDAGAGDAAVVPPTPAGPNCLKGTGDFNAKGPYKVKRTNLMIGSQGPYTIFAPDPLEAACPHPIVAWGNGTGVSDADTYAFYQDHAASWGIVVVASHNPNVGSGAWHKAGLDYLLEQNKTQGSPFFGKLSTRAGTSGHSQGGGGANQGSSHPNVEAIVNVQGAFGAAPRGKAFLCLTGTADISPMGCKTAVDGASSPAFLANWEGGDHTGTATLLGFITNDPGTKQYMRLYSAWFRCFLANDPGACAQFKGGMDCPLCKEKGWAQIYAKNY